MRPEGHYKCSKMTQGDNKVYYRPNHSKKISKFLRFILFFSKYFLQNELKKLHLLKFNNKTSKYNLVVRQLSDQCFSDFLLSLLIKISKHFFFEIFLFGRQKNPISSLRSKSKKVLEFIVCICIG
jgi:hypothetical protein